MAGSISSNLGTSGFGSNTVEEKLSHLQLVQENDNLKAQVMKNYIYKLTFLQ